MDVTTIVELSDSEKEYLRQKINTLQALKSIYSEDFVNLASIMVKDLLLDRIKLAYSEVKQKSGYLFFRNLPIDESLPATPSNGQRPQGKNITSEAILLGLTKALGFLPLSYQQENDGLFTQEITPIKGKENTQSSNGMIDLPFHTDCAFLNRDVRPHTLTLLCLRDTCKTPTKISSLRNIIKHLSKEDINLLMSDNFVHGIPKTFASSEEFEGSVLYLENGCLEVRLSSSYVRPKNSKANKVLSLFRGLAIKHHEKIHWTSGDLLVFNNLKCLHSRGKIEGDRWLQRCYGSENFKVSTMLDIHKNTIHRQPK
jgi:hypothetical protein